MSTNQVKADPIDSQLKRGGRGGGGAYRASQSSAKGGGGGGLGPSAAAPNHSNQQHLQQQQQQQHPHQHQVRPSHGNAGGRRKNGHGHGHGHGWHFPPNVANGGEPILQPGRQQQFTGNSMSALAPRRPQQNNGVPVKQPVPPSTPPEKPQPARNAGPQAPVFQFGSLTPGFAHNVAMQIPARTASAPPNLDEQKREQAQYEAALAAKHIPVLQHAPVLEHPGVQHHMPMPPAPVVRQMHIPVPVPMVASQSASIQPVLPQHGLVQPSYVQPGKFQQPPPVITSQVQAPIVGPQSMIGHQMPQVSAFPYYQSRLSKAIKIVDPKTQEEVRLDTKVAERPPVPGVQQPRPLSYGAAPQYSSQGSSLSTAGAPYVPQQLSVDSPRITYTANSSYSRGVQASASSTAQEAAVPEVMVRPESIVQDRTEPRSGNVVEETVAVSDIPEADEIIPKASSPEDASIVSPPEEIVREKDEPSTNASVTEVTADEVVADEVAADEVAADEAAEDSKKDDVSIEEKLIEEAVIESTCVQDNAVQENVDAAVEEGVAETSEVPSTTQAVAVSLVSQVSQVSQVAEVQSSSQVPEVVPEVKQGNKKKNKKKLLAKADAAGSTADLYNAYKAPDEKKEDLVKTEQAEEVQQVQEPEVAESKSIVEEDAPKEIDDWEDAADLPTPAEEQTTQVKRYTRDFLLTCRDQHTSLPADFEMRPEVETILASQLETGGRLSRRIEDDRWAKPGITPVSGRPQDVRIDGMFRPGGISPGMRFPAPFPNMPHMIPGGRGADALSWIHPQRGLIPSPHAPLPAMHKAENRYEIGKVSDEEEAKQRQVKAILNKLTPQNFEKLFEQVQEVGIEMASTLTGVISQIFDKAIMEPTFCETYARFCVQLSLALPEFTEDGEKITFKRVLLNKCQEEFERGKREEEEAGKTEEDGVSITAEERESRRVKARRRMLGNIRFIGELYKNSMLTERIMHECIKTLLGGYQDPDEEDVEALCKLMTTIGKLIDHNKAKAHMDAYFQRIAELSCNVKLPSRLRFGLQDVMDLRKNDWQQRRKVEGPKKIEEVHRDAHQERLAQTSQTSRDGRYSRGISMNRRIPPSPGAMSPLGRGLPNRFVQDVRKDDPPYPVDARPMAMPVHRAEELNFAPQGGLGRGPVRGAGTREMPRLQVDGAKRPGTAPSMDRGPYTSRDDYSSKGFGGPLLDRPTSAAPRGLERSASDRLTSYSSLDRPSTPPAPAVQAPALSDEQLKEKSSQTIEEYYSIRDEMEAAQCVQDLGRPDFHAAMISQWISGSFEKKDVERDSLAKLIKHLRSKDPALLTYEQMNEGFSSVLSIFEDIVVDVPKATDYLGCLMGKLVAQGVFPLLEVNKLVRECEPDMLSSEDALKIFGTVLETIRKENSEDKMLELYRASGVRIQDFVPTPSAGEVEEFLRRRNLQCLDPIFPVEAFLKDALEKNAPAADIQSWLEANAGAALGSPEFPHLLMTEILNHVMLPLPAGDFEAALRGKTDSYFELLKKMTPGKAKAAAANQRQYIVAIQQFAHAHGHPSGLMSALFNNLYRDEVIPERAFNQWEDDVDDKTPGREQAIREVRKWLQWLKEAPEEADDE